MLTELLRNGFCSADRFIKFGGSIIFLWIDIVYQSIIIRSGSINVPNHQYITKGILGAHIDPWDKRRTLR